MDTPRKILYGKGYDLTAAEIAELKYIYGQDTTIGVSDFVPPGYVVRVGIPQDADDVQCQAEAIDAALNGWTYTNER